MSAQFNLDPMTRFERGVLFRIARWVAFSVCLLLFLGMLGGAAYFAKESLGSQADKPTVDGVLGPETPATVEGAADAPDAGQTESVTEGTSLAGLRFSPEIQEFLTKPGFKSWLENNMERVEEDQRQDCADGMGQAVLKGRERKMDDNAVVQSWMSACQEFTAKTQVEKAERTTKMMYAAGAVGLLLTLLACYSLVLILIAIERNTRPAQGV